MKVLFLVSAFNGMAQRAWIELDRLNHQVKVHVALSEESMRRAADEFQPDLIVAPYLTKKIPAEVWRRYPTFIIHPGIPGDRGASSLDWAILRDEKEWGVTILEAAEKMDAGDIWASEAFPMRPVSKAQLYRHEVTQAAMKAMLRAIERFQSGSFQPRPLDYADPAIRGRWNRRTRPDDFRIDWGEDAESILRKIRAADSAPGAPVELGGRPFLAYGGHLEGSLKGAPGEVIAQRHGAVCIGTGDGRAVWITHLKATHEWAIKLPATMALGEAARTISESPLPPEAVPDKPTWHEIRYEEAGEVGFLHFDFYNGAMSTDQCRRLLDAYRYAKGRPVKVIVLMGGEDLWSNGIHLNVIEAADNPADASWDNILAIDDLIREIILDTDHYVISALQGNAGGGGVPFALAADKVVAREGIVLNPHTRNIGLYGSEYWTYLLPRRIGTEKARQFTEQRLPWGTAIAKEIGLIDDVFGETADEFRTRVRRLAADIARLPYFDKLLMSKKFQRRKDERMKPLEKYREEELAIMRRNFYDNDWGYHQKRFRFVHKIPDPEVVQRLMGKDWYSARRKIYRRRKWESVYYPGG